MANTVAIGCNLPHGLTLIIYDTIPDHDGVREQKKPLHPAIAKTRRSVKLAGANSKYARDGFGITEVDKEYWDAWLAINNTLACVKNGSFIVAKTVAAVEDEIKRLAGKVRTGFERLDAENHNVEKAETE